MPGEISGVLGRNAKESNRFDKGSPSYQDLVAKNNGWVCFNTAGGEGGGEGKKESEREREKEACIGSMRSMLCSYLKGPQG